MEIPRIPENFPSLFPSLQRLFLRYLKLDEFPACLCTMTSLVQLDLSGNEIEVIPSWLQQVCFNENHQKKKSYKVNVIQVYNVRRTQSLKKQIDKIRSRCQ